MGLWRTGHARWAIVMVVACLAPGAAAVQDLCGATIEDDLRLEQDLFCSGDGLIAGADDITIDLNGHTLTGAGVGIGINVTGRTAVSIRGGTISNFAAGMRLNTATEITVKEMQFTGNPEGIDMQAGAIGNTIKDSTFRNSTIRAIMMRSNTSGNDVRNNAFAGNRVGILVFGGVDNTLRGNVVSGSTLAGIRYNVLATGNLTRDNTLTSNVAGIEFLVTPTGSATGNDFRDNRIETNGCGIKGPSAGNTFKDTAFQGNVADTCS